MQDSQLRRVSLEELLQTFSEKGLQLGLRVGLLVQVLLDGGQHGVRHLPLGPLQAFQHMRLHVSQGL